jgi:hypothetical protein
LAHSPASHAIECIQGVEHAHTFYYQRKGEEHGPQPQQTQEEARETASAQYLVNSLRRLQDALGELIEMMDAARAGATNRALPCSTVALAPANRI